MPGSLPPSFDRFGEQLEEAARERIRQEQAVTGRTRARRRRRVVLGTVAAFSVPAVAAAGLVSLLGQADAPLPRDTSGVPAGSRPAADPAVVAASAVPDPDGGPPWAVRLFANPAGKQCVTLGRLRDGRIGQLRRGAFRPLPANAAGVCGSVETAGVLFAVDRHAGSTPRTVVYGLSASRTPLTVRLEGRRRVVRPRALGTFVLVLSGVRSLSGATLSLEVDGRRVRRRLG